MPAQCESNTCTQTTQAVWKYWLPQPHSTTLKNKNFTAWHRHPGGPLHPCLAWQQNLWCWLQMLIHKKSSLGQLLAWVLTATDRFLDVQISLNRFQLLWLDQSMLKTKKKRNKPICPCLSWICQLQHTHFRYLPSWSTSLTVYILNDLCGKAADSDHLWHPFKSQRSSLTGLSQLCPF